MPVLHYVRRFNLAERFKNLPQIVPCDVARQITYINIHFGPFHSAASYQDLDNCSRLSGC